ncbi:RNA-binding protein 48 [Bufo bufo]|uniref:RNA-binding protein 48 n=1 Tax=Bufo bufo TaxID=8384 RepID=UPI001ABECE50|nr:RNA-binding protein 48 [Bufo bufo]XP_040287121.1 RNA-binding protein 48 [Bufo bufo]
MDPRSQLEVHPHHEQRKICASRAKYRDGRKPRAVKVYTINLESRYLLVQGVPAIGVMKELIEHFALYGAIEEYNPLDEYPAEQFTEVYLIKFQRVQSARVAKRKLDECSFFGGVLHVCYAPEFESVQETREKLQDRRRYVARATADRDGQSAERRKVVPEKSHLLSASVESSSAGTSTWGPSPQPDDFSPMLPSMPPEPYQEYRSTSPSSSYSRNLPSGGSVHPPPCSGPERTGSPAHNILRSNPTRFMPRTTQLQERQKRREASLALSLSLADSPEVVIGPKLPELPKLDLEDDSLNTSAKLIRGKLNQVSKFSPLTAPEDKSVDTQSAPPVKQRRRI